MTIDQTIAEWIDILNRNAPGDTEFTLELSGRKYHRIVSTGQWQRHVHAFIDNDGHVFKPAGWKAPAKGVRYDLNVPESAAALLRDADNARSFSGGYLYQGQQSYILSDRVA